MKNMTRHTGTLEILKRLPGSINGNPRYLLTVDGFICRTGVDHAIAYEIANFDGRQVTAEIGTYYGKATIKTVRSA